MRTVKLVIVFLFSLLLIAFANKYFPSFVATGQTNGSSLSAPTGVAASDNAYITKVGITWNTVRGATTYRIHRNTSNDAASSVSVGTTAAGAFFDTTAVVGQTYFYWVRAENGSLVSSFSEPDQGSRAAGVINGPLQPLEPPPVPPGNPLTATKAYLGKALFWDEQLSSTRTVACGTCHFATDGGADSRTAVNNLRTTNPGGDLVVGTADDVFGSPGVPSNNSDGTYNLNPIYSFREQVTGRKSRSYIDAAYSNTLFWDGRATPTFTDPLTGSVLLQNGAALESQVIGPPVNAAEMAHSFRDWTEVALRVSMSRPLALSPSIPTGLRDWIGGRSYIELFEEAFGTPEVTPARIAMAIATFERTVYSDRTPLDQSVAQISPLTPAEARGQGVFNNQGRCNTCHAGNLLSDNQFHNIGLRPQTEDTGRFQVTGNPNNMGEFRTPSLRNVALRAPYMHNGHFATLEEVVEFYNGGGDFDAPNIDRNRIRPLNLSAQQKSDLLAFLRRPLTDPRVASGSHPFDRPLLYSESSHVPQVTGSGVQGAGGQFPQVTAIEPPLVGNPSFTVGVSNALGGAQAVLVIDSADPGTGPNIPAAASFARVQLQLSGSGAGQGFGSVSVQIPDTPTLAGSTFFGRWFVNDPSAPGGVAVTPAFRMTIFGPALTGATNPIDEEQFYVLQHYLDFLSRTPDPPGWAFWSSNISKCGTSAACTDIQRTTTSGAFFLSPEFQYTGGFIYHLYKAALGGAPNYDGGLPGRFPRYEEFVRDMQRINQGIIVNNQLSGSVIETNRATFVNEFVQRPEFKAIYDSLNNQQFVDKLFQNTGINASAQDRAALVAGLDAGTETRATVLRKVADGTIVISEGNVQYTTAYGKAFIEQEFNRAFVLMEYFGYLRRDPDTAGYNFWLGKLNFYGNYIDAEMVRSFIVSPEYRSRFGQP